jgi:hypothetical protein
MAKKKVKKPGVPLHNGKGNKVNEGRGGCNPPKKKRRGINK